MIPKCHEIRRTTGCEGLWLWHKESYKNLTCTRRLGVESMVSISEACAVCMVLFGTLASKKLKNFLDITQLPYAKIWTCEVRSSSCEQCLLSWMDFWSSSSRLPPCTNVSLLACRELNRITSLIPEGGEALWYEWKSSGSYSQVSWSLAVGEALWTQYSPQLLWTKSSMYWDSFKSVSVSLGDFLRR